jgi:hypothetical protein
VNYLPGLASNGDPPDLCLLSSLDYRQESLVPRFSYMSFVKFIPILFFDVIIIRIVFLISFIDRSLLM